MKKERKRLDDLWSKIVKLRGKNKCEYCGNPSHLNSHHIFSRSNNSVRWDIDNGIALCPLHHTLGKDSFHKAPLETAEWIKKRRGDAWYDKLRLRAQAIYKPDYKLIELDLKNELEGLLKKSKAN